MSIVKSSRLAGVFVSAVLAAPVLAEPATQPVAGSKVIADEAIAVRIMDPASPDRYYRGVRFTPVAGVISAIVDGKEYLFYKAKPDPAVDVAGLFGEFDLRTNPPGFAAAETSGAFVKVGVGRLTKTNDKYQFYTAYPVRELARTETRWKADSVEFDQVLPVENGIGYRLGARLAVKDRTLTMVWTLTNTGTVPLNTQQYLHNSFRFAERPIGPGYTLEFPFEYQATGLKGAVVQDARQIRFAEPLKKPQNLEVNYPAGYTGENTVTVADTVSGMRVECHTSAPGAVAAVHVAETYLCPEQFIQISLEPGQTQEWVRRYVFQ